MAWATVKITVDGKDWVGQKSSTQSLYSVPFACGLKGGDSFTVDGQSFTAESVVNLLSRDETLLVGTKESTNDKPTSRGSKRQPSGADVQDEAESGLDSED